MTYNVFGGTLNLTQPSTSPVCITYSATQWHPLWW